MTPALDGPRHPLAADEVAALFEGAPGRWWLSGGVALDRWLGRAVRERAQTDVSTIPSDLEGLLGSLPARYSAWIRDDEGLIAWAEATPDTDIARILIRDDDAGAWVLQVNVEDGTANAWLYRRDSRLQLPWNRAVLDIGGIPTGAPEVQLVWKALRPSPQDEQDKDAVLPGLDAEARQWWERAILSIHPHSTWSIHARSPFAPAKASWNRPQN